MYTTCDQVDVGTLKVLRASVTSASLSTFQHDGVPDREEPFALDVAQQIGLPALGRSSKILMVIIRQSLAKLAPVAYPALVDKKPPQRSFASSG